MKRITVKELESLPDGSILKLRWARHTEISIGVISKNLILCTNGSHKYIDRIGVYMSSGELKVFLMERLTEIYNNDSSPRGIVSRIRCPICGGVMLMATEADILINYCINCNYMSHKDYTTRILRAGNKSKSNIRGDFE